MKIQILLILATILFCQTAEGQWRQVGIGGSEQIYCFGINNNDLFACTDFGIYKSSDDGGNWIPVNTGLKSHIARALTVSNNIIFAGTDSGIYFSSDTGSHWMPFAPSITSTILSISIRGDDIFAGVTDTLLHSIDGGKNWVISPLAGSPVINSIFFTDTNIILGTSKGIYVSSDNGTSWNSVSLLVNADVFSFVLDDKNIIAVTDEGLFRSIDGKDWAAFGLNSTYLYSAAVIGANIFAGSINGFYLSKDDGISWSHSDSVFTNNYLYALTIKDKYIFAGTYNKGIWRRPLSEMITASVQSQIFPSYFHIAQNYPNPFSETTTFRFDLPERAFLSLKVYDITGREVAVLANETLDAGSYSRTFNAEGIPNGTYICRFEAGGFREERTLILLR